MQPPQKLVRRKKKKKDRASNTKLLKYEMRAWVGRVLLEAELRGVHDVVVVEYACIYMYVERLILEIRNKNCGQGEQPPLDCGTRIIIRIKLKIFLLFVAVAYVVDDSILLYGTHV